MARGSLIQFQQSAYNLGSRNQVGDQVERRFVRDLLKVLGDCRLLWLPSLTDTTTSTERSRHAATITWSESLATFDAARTRLGSGIAVAFNGTDEDATVPDNDRLSFGDSAADEPFSVVALVKVSAGTGNQHILTRYDLTTGDTKREYRLFILAAEHPQFDVWDESAGARLGRRDASALSEAQHLLVGTYDGGASSAGLRLYVDGARTDDTDDSSGTYTAMENTASLLRIGARESTGGAAENHWEGSMSLIAITAKQLAADEVWSIKEMTNAYFGLSL